MTPEERELKERQLLAAREKKRRRLLAPLLYVALHAGQARARKAFEDNRIIIMHPGNRWGKTFFNAVLTVCHLYGYWIFEVPGLKLTDEGDYPARDDVPPEYWIRRADGIPLQLPAKHLAASGLPAKQGIGGALWPAIEALLPPAVRAHGEFRLLRGQGSVPVKLFMPPSLSTQGATISFASGDQDSMAYEGQSFTSCGIDEPPKQQIWTPLWRGMTDHMAKVWISATPVGPNAPWIYEVFIMGGDEIRESGVGIGIVSGSIWENPYTTDESKRQFLAGNAATSEEQEAREHGAWSMLSHQAFPQFDHSIHIVPKDTPVPPGAVLGVACDPAHRRPYAFIWGAWTQGGELLIYDEWPKGQDHSDMFASEKSVPEYARLVRQIENGKAMDYRCLDPRFGAANHRIKGEIHTTIQDDFLREGQFWDCRIEGTEREEIGIEKIRQLLNFRKDQPLTQWNRPRLRVREDCTNTIRALAYSIFVPSRDPHKLPDTLAEKYKDFRDTLRYLVLYPWVPRGRQGQDYISDQDFEAENSGDWW